MDNAENAIVKKGKKTRNASWNTLQNMPDWATRTSLIAGSEIMCIGSVDSFCSTSGTHLVTYIKNPIISHVQWCHKRGKKDAILTATNGTYPLSSVTQIFLNH